MFTNLLLVASLLGAAPSGVATEDGPLLPIEILETGPTDGPFPLSAELGNDNKQARMVEGTGPGENEKIIALREVGNSRLFRDRRPLGAGPLFGIQQIGGWQFLAPRISRVADPAVTVETVRVPLNVLDLMLDPVREAHLLLPQRLAPPSVTAAQTSDKATQEIQEAEFKVSEQRRLLSTSLAPRIDTPDEKANWKWSIQLGGTFRQGNTDSTNVNSLFRAERRSNRSVITGKIGAIYNESGGGDPNRRVYGDLLVDRNLRGRWVYYGREEIELDQAKNIDLRSVASAGLGFRFIDLLEKRWIVRSGPTVSYIKYAPDADESDEFHSGWLMESEYRRLLGESVRVEWTATAYPEFDEGDQFRVRNDAALVFPIAGKTSPWNWKIGTKHEYQIEPAEDTRSSDVEGYFAITYANK